MQVDRKLLIIGNFLYLQIWCEIREMNDITLLRFKNKPELLSENNENVQIRKFSKLLNIQEN